MKQELEINYYIRYFNNTILKMPSQKEIDKLTKKPPPIPYKVAKTLEKLIVVGDIIETVPNAKTIHDFSEMNCMAGISIYDMQTISKPTREVVKEYGNGEITSGCRDNVLLKLWTIDPNGNYIKQYDLHKELEKR